MARMKTLGAAAILVDFENGIISIYHAEDKVLLKSWVAGVNDWDKIWALFEVLEKSAFIKGEN